jgi:organic radical activating enzyme
MRIVEIMESIQGEGIDTGSPATFIRLAGCNKACSFCDTSFLHYDEIAVKDILEKCDKKLVVITGGEPLLQLDELFTLCLGLRLAGKIIGLETNGSFPLGKIQGWVDSVSMSPKDPRDDIKLEWCTSLKLLFPYLKGATPDDFCGYKFKQGFIQPIDGVAGSMQGAIEEVKRLNTQRWKLGVQLHKLIGVQ